MARTLVGSARTHLFEPLGCAGHLHVITLLTSRKGIHGVSAQNRIRGG